MCLEQFEKPEDREAFMREMEEKERKEQYEARVKKAKEENDAVAARLKADQGIFEQHAASSVNMRPFQRSVLNKVTDYLLGDGPNNRYALICVKCHTHNGLVMPDDVGLMYRCTACSFLNGGTSVNNATGAPNKTPARSASSSSSSSSASSSFLSPAAPSINPLLSPNSSLTPGLSAGPARRTPRHQGDANEDEESVMARIRIGDRVEAFPGARKGRVAYVGPVPETGEPGVFVGVNFVKAEGKNDGEVNGKRYFQTLPMHGGFIRANCITVLPQNLHPSSALGGDLADGDVPVIKPPNN